MSKFGEVVAEPKETPSSEVSISQSDLKELIAAAVTAAVEAGNREKPPTAAQLREIEEQQQTRKELAQSMNDKRENALRFQKICSHKHKDGKGRGVYVENGNFILCQGCKAIVHPGVAPSDYRGTEMFDTRLFNELYQNLPV